MSGWIKKELLDQVWEAAAGDFHGIREDLSLLRLAEPYLFNKVVEVRDVKKYSKDFVVGMMYVALCVAKHRLDEYQNWKLIKEVKDVKKD